MLFRALLKILTIPVIFSLLLLLQTHIKFTHAAAAAISPVFLSDTTTLNNHQGGGGGIGGDGDSGIYKTFSAKRTTAATTTLTQHKPWRSAISHNSSSSQQRYRNHHFYSSSSPKQQHHHQAAFIQPIITTYQTKIPKQVRFTIGFAVGYKFKFQIIYLSSRALKVATIMYGISELWNFTDMCFDFSYKRKSVMEKVDGYINKYRVSVRETIGHPYADVNMRDNGELLGLDVVPF